MSILEELRAICDKELDKSALSGGQNQNAPKCPCGEDLHCDVIATRTRIESMYGPTTCHAEKPCFVQVLLYKDKS